MIQTLIMNPTESISIEIKECQECCNSYNAAEALKVHTEVAHREYFNGNLVNTLECHSFNEMFIIAKILGKHNKIVHERVSRCNCLALVVQ